jgi:phospholipid/cholesterol/gamma-HCH transport system substrate-binding protein
MDIESGIIIGDSTTALLDVEFLGGVSIVLNIGDINNPLEPGDTVIAQVNPTLNELLKSSALPVADNLQVTIRRINTILEEFSEHSESMINTIKNVEGITYKTNIMLGENRVAVKETITEFKELTGKLNHRMDDLGVLMSKYSDLADSLKAIDFKKTLEEANTLLATMNETLLLMQDENGTIGRMLKDDSVYVSLNNALLDLDLLLIHMNENPKHFFKPLGKNRKKIEKDLKKQAEENN